MFADRCLVEDVKESGTPGSQQQGTEAKADVMEPEAPVIAEEDRTCALRIQNFVRPFTEKAAKEMLSTYGNVAFTFRLCERCV